MRLQRHCLHDAVSLRVAKARRRRALPAAPPSMRVVVNTRIVTEGRNRRTTEA